MTSTRVVYSTSTEVARMHDTARRGIARVMAAPRPCEHPYVTGRWQGEFIAPDDALYDCIDCGAVVEASFDLGSFTQ
jgi:hypothetical protein